MNPEFVNYSLARIRPAPGAWIVNKPGQTIG
jgi:hypothetical protein